MRGEKDRRAFTAQLQDRVLHSLGVHWIEAGERLVQHHQGRVVQDRGDELHFLLHPFRQLVDAAQAPIREPQAFEPLSRPFARAPAVDALHLAEKDEHVEHAHLAVQPALFREVADPLRVRASATGLAEQAHGAGVGLQDVQDHADRSGLAGAVRAQQTVDHAARYGQ